MEQEMIDRADLLAVLHDLIEGIELRWGAEAETGWEHDPTLMVRARAALAKAAS